MSVPIRSSRINVHLDLEQRRKGLLWYNLYNVSFVAHYLICNDTSNPHLTVQFFLPTSDGSYADLTYLIGGRRIDNATALDQGKVRFDLQSGRETTIDVGSRSRGMNSWLYRFSNRVEVESVNDFALTMTTNFHAIDFPVQMLLPVTEQSLGQGWRLQWKYSTLVTGNGIGMAIPYPLQPGPLAQRITFWAPVALLFYLFVMLLLTTMRGIRLHPVNYFFLACAFFAFHLLFAYLVDRIPLEAAFAISSLVSIFLTVSYLRLVAGWRFAAVESGLAQFIYLILFSYALFNEGWSGLTITIGAIITLFVAMQLTAHVTWSERLVEGV
ncbi:MAG TPA: inner membrane CreD family protein [Candidatus Tyrphobacter sp.]